MSSEINQTRPKAKGKTNNPKEKTKNEFEQRMELPGGENSRRENSPSKSPASDNTPSSASKEQKTKTNAGLGLPSIEENKNKKEQQNEAKDSQENNKGENPRLEKLRAMKRYLESPYTFPLIRDPKSKRKIPRQKSQNSKMKKSSSRSQSQEPPLLKRKTKGETQNNKDTSNASGSLRTAIKPQTEENQDSKLSKSYISF